MSSPCNASCHAPCNASTPLSRLLQSRVFVFASGMLCGVLCTILMGIAAVGGFR